MIDCSVLLTCELTATVQDYLLTYLLQYYLLPGKGSRCEEDNNAFWSAAAALLPQDLIEKRQARAAGRILGLNYKQEPGSIVCYSYSYCAS